VRDTMMCKPIRTPVGGYGGALRSVDPALLAEAAVRGLISRTSVPPESVDDVLYAQCYPNGEARAIGRVTAPDAGLSVTVAGLQLERPCGSGLQAVVYAAMQVQTGASDVVIAGGVKRVMSNAEYQT
jgi:acetyl-CoA C-acetyltransferase